MVCQHCGHTIPDDSEYCSYCGKLVNESTKKVNRTNRWLKAVCIILVIAIVLTCLYFFRSTPTRSTRKFLDAVQEQDWDTARKYYSGDPANLGIPSASTLEKFGKGGAELYQKLLDKGCDFQYEVVSEKQDGKEADVAVAFTTYDFSTLFRGKGGLTFESLGRKVDNLTQRTKHTQCTFHLKKNKWGQWKVSMLGVDQIDAMTGGVYSGLVKTIQSAVGAPVSSAGKTLSEYASGAGEIISNIAEAVNEAVSGTGKVLSENGGSGSRDISSVVHDLSGVVESMSKEVQ